MKTKSIYLALLLLGVVSWSCKNNDVSVAPLQSTVNANVQDLTNTLNAITSSEGYQVLNPTTLRSTSGVIGAFDSTYTNIGLADIAGVYDYKATKFVRGGIQLLRYFNKSASSSGMIVKLPIEKVRNYGALLRYFPSDTLLVNNYIISLSDYNYSFNRFLGYNYRMASTINIKGVNAGAFSIATSKSKINGYKFASDFVFSDGKKVSCSYSTGDTAIAKYTISDGAKTVYQEKYTAIRSLTDKKYRERQYSLTIGNVDIVRGQGGLDSAKVYLNGVLQLKSTVKIVNTNASSDGTENSMTNNNREIQITFDDGTTQTISQILGANISTIRSLFATVRQSTFAVGIVDWIAWDVFTNKP